MYGSLTACDLARSRCTCASLDLLSPKNSCARQKAIYIAENSMAFADQRLLTCLREEIDRVGCGLCSVELFVAPQRPSDDNQTLCLTGGPTNSPENF